MPMMKWKVEFFEFGRPNSKNLTVGDYAERGNTAFYC